MYFNIDIMTDYVFLKKKCLRFKCKAKQELFFLKKADVSPF